MTNLKKIYQNWSLFLKNEDGATAIEYGLIAAGISTFIMAILVNFGDVLKDDVFKEIHDELTK